MISDVSTAAYINQYPQLNCACPEIDHWLITSSSISMIGSQPYW